MCPVLTEFRFVAYVICIDIIIYAVLHHNQFGLILPKCDILAYQVNQKVNSLTDKHCDDTIEIG